MTTTETVTRTKITNQLCRIGVIGTENSHVKHLLADFNGEPRYGGHRIVGLVGTDVERTAELAGQFGVTITGAEPEALLDQVDAVVVCDRHGDLHLPHARPFLDAGLPVYVDKPLACTTADASEILRLAEAGGSPVMSCSTLRLSPAVELAADRTRELGELRAVQMSGPGDADSPYGGIMFYGIHGADTVLRFAPGDLGDVSVRQRDGLVMIDTWAGDVAVTITLVRPGEAGTTPFQLTLIGSKGVIAQRISLGPHYMRPTVDAFAHLLNTGVAVAPASEQLRPIALLEQARRLVEAG